MTSQQCGYHILELGTCHQVSVFRECLGITKRHTPGYYRDFMHRVSIRQHFSNKGMPCLMIGSDFLFLGAYPPTLPLRAGNNTVYRFLKLLHLNNLLAPPGSQNGCLVDQVGQVSTTETSRLLS